MALEWEQLIRVRWRLSDLHGLTHADRLDCGWKERGPDDYQAKPHLILCAPVNGDGSSAEESAEATAEESIARQDRAGCRSDSRGRPRNCHRTGRGGRDGLLHRPQFTKAHTGTKTATAAHTRPT